MSIKYFDVKNDDYSIVYYGYHAIGKIKSLYSSFIQNGFEANEIIKDVYLGNIDSCYDRENLKKLGITHIISVISGFSPPYPDDFEYLVINALDTTNTNLKDHFEVCSSFIDNALNKYGGKVLIHCMAGKSRSATILAAYIIKHYGTDTNNALKSIKIKRNIIEPNSYFIEQLNEYHKELYSCFN